MAVLVRDIHSGEIKILSYRYSKGSPFKKLKPTGSIRPFRRNQKRNRSLFNSIIHKCEKQYFTYYY